MHPADMAAIHSDGFKRDAVRIVLSSGLTRRQLASDLGIGLSTLGKWVRAIPFAMGQKALQGNSVLALHGLGPDVGIVFLAGMSAARSPAAAKAALFSVEVEDYARVASRLRKGATVACNHRPDSSENAQRTGLPTFALRP